MIIEYCRKCDDYTERYERDGKCKACMRRRCRERRERIKADPVLLSRYKKQQLDYYYQYKENTPEKLIQWNKAKWERIQSDPIKYEAAKADMRKRNSERKRNIQMV